MKVLITGIAGFIGSSIAERCLSEGYQVSGIDVFTDNYAREFKERNVGKLSGGPGFSYVEADILAVDQRKLLDGVDVVFHEAAIPGVRDSWGARFEEYVDNNILVTQKLLEAAKSATIKKFIYASSSSVYGDAESFPTSEAARPRPMSPYGVTKLAAEHLCMLYNRNFGVPAVALRYFTVYGPKQRPDMAFHKLLKAVSDNREFGLFGDGSQTRDFTFIDDAVQANMAAVERGKPGSVYNIGGGSRVSMNDVIEMAGRVSGKTPLIRRTETQKGDVRDTSADITRAAKDLGYNPGVSLEQGLEKEWAWIREIYKK